jgi:chromosome segregation ATPase
MDAGFLKNEILPKVAELSGFFSLRRKKLAHEVSAALLKASQELQDRDVLRRALDQAQANVQDSDRRLAQADQSHQQLATALKNSTDDCAALTAEFANQTALVASLEREKDLLRREKESLQRDRESLQRDKETLRGDLQNIDQILNQLRSAQDALQAEIAEVAEMSKIEKTLRESFEENDRVLTQALMSALHHEEVAASEA